MGYITLKQTLNCLPCNPVSIFNLLCVCVFVCRELGLDELLTHCEEILEKLRYPEKEASYQAMAGTALFTHTAFDMLQNHSRYRGLTQSETLILILCNNTDHTYIASVLQCACVTQQQRGALNSERFVKRFYSNPINTIRADILWLLNSEISSFSRNLSFIDLNQCGLFWNGCIAVSFFFFPNSCFHSVRYSKTKGATSSGLAQVFCFIHQLLNRSL